MIRKEIGIARKDYFNFFISGDQGDPPILIQLLVMHSPAGLMSTNLSNVPVYLMLEGANYFGKLVGYSCEAVLSTQAKIVQFSVHIIKFGNYSKETTENPDYFIKQVSTLS